jgi:quercetin dioxygenase-like cupin family protein
MNRKRFLMSLTGFTTLSLLPELSAAISEQISHLPALVKEQGEGKKLNVLGDQMTVKLTSEDTGGLYGLVEQNNDPGTGIPMHVHAHENEVFKVLKGEVEFKLGDNLRVLKAGDLVFCPRGLPHSWRVTGDGKALVDLGFFPAGMEKMFAELSKLPPGPPDLKIVSEITGRYGISFV